MTFIPSTYANFVAGDGPSRERLFLQYLSPRNDFDYIIIGSGIGGGVLADALAEQVGANRQLRGRIGEIPYW